MNIYLTGYLVSVIFASVTVLASEPNDKDWGPISNNVQMAISIKADSAVIKTNEQFSLLVHVKNLSEANVGIFLEVVPSTDTWGGLNCEIISPSGKDISPKVIYYRTSGRNLNVPPHGGGEFEFKLSDICKFEEIGTYRIVAKKTILTDKDRGWIAVSNPLTINVISTNSVATNAVAAPGLK
jgi:hypothetical protein